MSIGNYERIVSRIHDIGIREIDILGGEPTLHPDFKGILEINYEKQIKTSVSTNGTNVEQLENFVRAYPQDFLQIGVSLSSDTMSEDLHNFIVGHKPVLKSLYTRRSAISEIAEKYLRNKGIKLYVLYMDTVIQNDLKFSLPFYEYIKRMEYLKSLYQNIDGIFCSGFIPDANYPVLQHVRCPAGTTKLSVMPDGSVYPCYLFFRHKEFLLGNVFRDDFDSIWNNALLKYFRRFDGNQCVKSDCEVFSRCHGGCPAVTFLIHGYLNSQDPRCITYN